MVFSDVFVYWVAVDYSGNKKKAMRTISILSFFALLTYSCFGQGESKEHSPVAGARYPFFVFNNGVKDAIYDTPEQQVRLIKLLGYDGMEKIWADDQVEMLDALDKHGLDHF